MVTHSSNFAWRILWTEEPGGLQSMGVSESDTTERLSTHSCRVSISVPSLLLFPPKPLYHISLHFKKGDHIYQII